MKIEQTEEQKKRQTAADKFMVDAINRGCDAIVSSGHPAGYVCIGMKGMLKYSEPLLDIFVIKAGAVYDYHNIPEALGKVGQEMLDGWATLLYEAYRQARVDAGLPPDAIDRGYVYRELLELLRSTTGAVEQRKVGKPTPCTFEELKRYQESWFHTAGSCYAQKELEASNSAKITYLKNDLWGYGYKNWSQPASEAEVRLYLEEFTRLFELHRFAPLQAAADTVIARLGAIIDRDLSKSLASKLQPVKPTVSSVLSSKLATVAKKPTVSQMASIVKPRTSNTYAILGGLAVLAAVVYYSKGKR
jgi:hypothetical protein